MGSQTPLKQPVKGIIFDYGATIDSNGMHWAEVIWQGYQSAGVILDKALFRKAYVHGERSLATHPYILPHHNFLELLQIKIRIQFEYLKANARFHYGSGEEGKPLLQIEGEDISPEDIRKKITPEELRFQDAIAEYCYRYAADCIAKALPVLEYLSGKYRLVLVSNFYGNIESVLKDFGLIHLFPDIVESAVVGIRKPDPAIFALGVEKTGETPESVVVVGDSYSKDIEPATALGCQTIWIKGIGWDDKEEGFQHDRIISDFAMLSSLL